MEADVRTRRSRLWRGFAWRAVVFLLLGAIVNVAVAWGCVFTRPDATNWQWLETRVYELAKHDYWEVNIERWLGAERVMSCRVSEGRYLNLLLFTPPSHVPPTLPSWIGIPQEPSMGDYRRVDAAGWPNLSFWASHSLTEKDGAFRSSPELGGFAFGSNIKNEYPLFTGSTTFPFFPIWPGFVINTLFYGAILWVMFATPFMLRRRRRIKRGLCPQCAYPVGTCDVCTECGGKIPSAKREVPACDASTK